ncbi:MAG: WD40 repeat domain-containing serine/threonine protein kinase [Planctomycetaceae bacterium]
MDASELSGVDDHFGFVAAGPRRSDDSLHAGSILGGVTIVRLIAEGGMGRVYEGRQATPERPVAVKVLRDGFSSASLVRRFEYEARVLARLRHPNIAQVFTSGVAEIGGAVTPFFVMEMVEAAQPITRAVTDPGLAMRQRVELMRRVSAAVAHGHQKGVIHRDLKPGNILVDGAGDPKVIDFGVARSLDPDIDERTQMTRAGDVVGTLRYMSPEQLGVGEGEVDARTDVYALGLVLHEVVTGGLPYELRGASFMEAARILGDPEPACVAAVERAARAARMSTGDARSLATIVATCLEKQPARRYATAVELEAELGRWLAGDAILARPPTLGESIIRFARRRRAAALAAMVALVSLVAAVTGISVFSIRAERERRLADAARVVAEEREHDAKVKTAEARAQLYVSNVLLAAAARDRDNVAEARRLLVDARGLAGDAGGGEPVELACVAASLDESIVAWEGRAGDVTAVGWSAAGDAVAHGTDDGGVWLGRVRGDVIEWDAVPVGVHGGRVWTTVFSPDGRSLASAAADGFVRIWSVAERTPVTTLGAAGAATYAAAFSPDGRILATGGRDRVVMLWRTDTWERIDERTGHEATVLSACFVGDSGRLATASADGTIRLWERGDHGDVEPSRVLQGHDDRVFCVAADPTGARIASAGEDGFVRLWSVASATETLKLKHPFRVNGVAWLDDGGRVATACADGVVRVWDAVDGRELRHLRGHVGDVWSIAARRGTSSLATGAADGTVRVWDADGRSDPVMVCDDKVLAVACSADGGTIATALANATVRLWDAATLKPGPVLRRAVGRVSDVRFSPDGATLAGGCDDGTVQLWDRGTGDRRCWAKPHDRRVYAVDFSPDGRLLATSAEDGSARIWDIPANTPLCDPLKHGRRVFRATFSPDGATLATACEDRTARLWSVADHHEIRRFEPHAGPVNWVAYSPDGTMLVTACSDGAARLWRVADGMLVTTLTGPVRQIWKAVFSPDGRRVAAVAADGTAQLWEVASGRGLAMLRGHTDQAWGVAFTPDGRALVTGSWDGTARLWGVSVADLTRRRSGR